MNKNLISHDTLSEPAAANLKTFFEARGALGGGIGTAIATDDKEHRSRNQGSIKHRIYDVRDYHDVDYGEPYYHARPRIPQGHMPPSGQCRVW